MIVNPTTFACYEKACAPPPAGKGGSSKGGRALTHQQLGNLSRFWNNHYERKASSKPVILTSAEAKPLVDRGLVRRTQRIPEGVRNIGNSKRWELTDEGKALVPKIEYGSDRRYRVVE